LNLEVADLAHDIFANVARLSDTSADKIINLDAKLYKEGNLTFSVAQVESGSFSELEARADELHQALKDKCKHEKLFFAALMVTDITALNSVLLVAGDKRFLEKIPFPKRDHENVFLCKGIMSRKKQLLPLLIEQLSAIGHV
jgi:manganese-dependent inorganic pyrophosphatase